MQKYNGIVATDAKNRKNQIIPLKTLHESYAKMWRDGVPTNFNHDSTIFLGWSVFNGIFLEPGRAYLTNLMMVPETQRETEELNRLRDREDYRAHVLEHQDELQMLVEKLGDALSADMKAAPVNAAVAIHDSGVVLRVFPELRELVDDDGLIELAVFEPVLPGVFKRGDFLLFAHRYFRRSFSLQNSLNKEFLSLLQETLEQREKLAVRIHLDFDLIGLAGTQQWEEELAFWWGPHFNDDLDSIPTGVTRHGNDQADRGASDLKFTEFGWYYQGGNKTLEIEEVCDRPTIIAQGEEYTGCRYIHSFLNPETGKPTHLDGAVRAYTDEKLISRLDTKLDHTTRDTVYTKLWRIDGDMPISLWKELITHYYRDNQLVGEYLGGKDEKAEEYRSQDRKRDEAAPPPLNKYIPASLSSGDGLRIYYHFCPAFKMDGGGIQVLSHDHITLKSSKAEKEEQFHIMESETTTVLKLIQRLGGDVKMPDDLTRIAYGERISNFPVFCCRDAEHASLVQEAVRMLCGIWHVEGDDRLISYSIAVNIGEDEAFQISFAGHINDFLYLFDKLGVDIPKREGIISWIEELYQANNHFGEANSVPRVFSMLTPTRQLQFKKVLIPQEYIEKYAVEDGRLNLEMQIPEDVGKEILAYRIQAAPVYMIQNSKCHKCGKEYRECQCVKLIDETQEIITRARFVGAVWTDRPAR